VSAAILDGKAISKQIRAEIAQQVAQFTEKTGVKPCLAAVLVGDDPASQVYVRNKERACGKAGIESQMHRLPESTTTEELLALIDKLNNDPVVNGILVQLPLPKGIDSQKVLDSVIVAKDVDAFHPDNVGRILQGRPRFMPCTPHGIQQLLIREKIETSGANVVVLGRSDIVGKPMAAMLMQKADGANATVTVAHSRTKNLAEVTRGADILIVAIGLPKFVTADMVKPGAVVIDVGINRTDDGLVGDVDFDAVKEVASKITPVPGGVGPLTIAMLLNNTLTAAKQQNS
jgi:methylenetetrahydrofolate dehydrogenase (NADP+)/methenyltetrahydrofolate cyclohydrolase